MKYTFLVLLGCLTLASPNALLAQQSPQLLTHGAMKECYEGRVTQDRTSRVGHFEKGQALGEQAVALDDRSADAHFALFCNLGELMRADGELSITSVMDFRRTTKELDRTLELAPEHLDALSPKEPSFSGFPPCLEAIKKRARSSFGMYF
ncbi:MAG: hypothetical protein ABIO96_12660 [Nitrospiraceae bacterium]